MPSHKRDIFIRPHSFFYFFSQILSVATHFLLVTRACPFSPHRPQTVSLAFFLFEAVVVVVIATRSNLFLLSLLLLLLSSLSLLAATAMPDP